ncbi:MAG TPA: metalloregulator ArsR/SmtB family transcription factor [Ktedonobacterales bacterium]|nr:metalloregulator ArsR/SmtB family transcription factor [Ktedonobacterales bacterium]
MSHVTMTPGAENSGAADTLAETTAVLHALAEPTRLRIYLFLRQGEACVCEIASELGLAQNLVSHHLGALRRVGLAHDRRDPSDARWVYYHLDPETLARLARTLGGLFNPETLGARTPSCGPAAPIPTLRRAVRPTRQP